MRFFKTPLLIAIAMLLWSPCSGKQLPLSVSDHLMVLTTHQGLVVEGLVVEIKAGKVTFDAGDRILEFTISEIASIQQILPTASSGSRWLPNPNKTRLLFSPTGRMINAGEGYLADHMVFFPAFAVGLTDYLTLGGGVSLFPGISIEEQMFFVMPKLGFYSSEDVNLAVGALVAGFPGTDENEGVGGGVSDEASDD